jgi:endonuclease-3 related protein
MMPENMRVDKMDKIDRIYRLLSGHYGDPGWWPADSAFEVMVGAILTQNTAWTNVEKAIGNLRDKGLLDPGKMLAADPSALAPLIRPAGYYNAKSLSLRNISRFYMEELGGDPASSEAMSTGELRSRLLEVKGVGPETADSILLYALNRPVCVVDAYTRRIFSRHGIVPADAGYETVQRAIHGVIRPEAAVYNRYHAMLVETAKRFCLKREPLCEECPLKAV